MQRRGEHLIGVRGSRSPANNMMATSRSPTAAYLAGEDRDVFAPSWHDATEVRRCVRRR